MPKPVPVSDEVLANNIKITIKDIVALQLDTEFLTTRSRTTYYKCIVMLAASVLEALVFHFIESNCRVNPELLKHESTSRYRQIQVLDSALIGTDKKILIAEKLPYDELKHVTRDSNSMNRFCYNTGLIEKKLFEKLEYARIKRNQIHIQTFETTRRSYTAKMVERISQAIEIMFTKLEEINPTSTQLSLL